MNRFSLNRRDLMRGGLGACAALGVDAAIPNMLANAAESSANSSNSGQRILVVLQLTGGNDGLNTVIPTSDDVYYSARPKLAIQPGDALKIGDDVGLHPALSGLHEMFDEGKLSIAQGVGYAKPNRSHFESMDIWHTCSGDKTQRTEGWLGRAAEQFELSGGDPAAMHLGDQKQPLALASKLRAVPSLAKLDDFRLKGNSQQALQAILQQQTASESDDLLSFVQSNTSSAIVSSQRVGGAVNMQNGESGFPDSSLAKKLSVVSQLIAAGLHTQIYYVELDGFDTHAKQADSHRSLLQTWSDATAAFTRKLEQTGDAERVCVFTFSEFGRRVSENASEGTDHGAAAPAFLLGQCVRGGLSGSSPDLTNLDDGDVRFSMDFRRIYASLLDDWLEIDSQKILGKRFETLPLFDI